MYDGNVFCDYIGGGLFKEYVDLFLRTAFDEKSKLFMSTSEQWLVCICCIFGSLSDFRVCLGSISRH